MSGRRCRRYGPRTRCRLRAAARKHIGPRLGLGPGRLGSAAGGRRGKRAPWSRRRLRSEDDARKLVCGGGGGTGGCLVIAAGEELKRQAKQLAHRRQRERRYDGRGAPPCSHRLTALIGNSSDGRILLQGKGTANSARHANGDNARRGSWEGQNRYPRVDFAARGRALAHRHTERSQSIAPARTHANCCRAQCLGLGARHALKVRATDAPNKIGSAPRSGTPSRCHVLHVVQYAAWRTCCLEMPPG